MDPSAQIGWGNHRAGTEAVGTQVLRDVFVQADELHEHAMSEMDGNSPMEEARAVAGHAGEALPSYNRDGNMQDFAYMEADVEGERAIGGVQQSLVNNAVLHPRSLSFFFSWIFRHWWIVASLQYC